MFTDGVVLTLDLLLRIGNGAGERLHLNGGVLVDVQGVHDTGHALAAEQADEVVLEGEIEA